MASQQLRLRVLGLVLLLFALQAERISPEKTPQLFQARSAGDPPARASVAVPPARAQEFLAPLSRTRRNIWDRSRPDVQQWIQQFMYLGFDEQQLEADLSYWMDHARAHDQGRQHHYDENGPLGPRASSYRHGADVNYDYY
uniref:ECRG4 augurin precursor a n=1 Tax=Tetraodon nigroviridis TaxID=99883 RepID=H3D8P6_TETNG